MGKIRRTEILTAGRGLIFAAAGFFLASSLVRGSGFRIVDQSPRAIGQADAFVAQADDPSAIYYNPAGLTQIRGGVAAGVAMVRTISRHNDSAGSPESSREKYHLLPFLYLTDDLGSENWRFGLGVYSPFGLGVDWDKEGFSRYWSTRSRLQMVAVNPTVAVEIFPGFSLGGGISYFYSELTSDRQVALVLPGPMGPIPAGDGSFESTGYGEAWGYNLGALYRFRGCHSLGLSFRSKTSVKHRGNARLTGLPGIPGGISDRFSSTLDLPPSLTFGYAWRPAPELKLEVNIDWTGWSTFRESNFDFSGDNPLFQDVSIPRDWRDAWFYALGAEWRVSSALALRAGGGYMESPVPEKTFDTAIPRTDQFALTLGIGYRCGDFSFDLAGLGSYGKKREVENEVGREVGADLNGSYRSINYLLSAGGTYYF